MNSDLHNDTKTLKCFSTKSKVLIIVITICLALALSILIPIGHNAATIRFNSFTGDVLRLILDGYNYETIVENLYNAKESADECDIYSVFMSREQRKEYTALREFLNNYPLNNVEECLQSCAEFDEILALYSESANEITELLDLALEEEQSIALSEVKDRITNWESASFEIEEFLEEFFAVDSVSIIATDMEYYIELAQGLIEKMEYIGIDGNKSCNVRYIYNSYYYTKYEADMSLALEVQHYKTNKIIYFDEGYLNLGAYCCFDAIKDYCNYNEIDLEMNTKQCITLNRAFIYNEIEPLIMTLSIDVYLEEYLSDYQYSGEYSKA